MHDYGRMQRACLGDDGLGLKPRSLTDIEAPTLLAYKRYHGYATTMDGRLTDLAHYTRPSLLLRTIL